MATQQATQDFVPIQEVRDGILVLKDGSMRAILMASSLNFSLKSADEQGSILYQFQNFLNTLDFTIQISIQSRRLDIRPYIALLDDQQKKQQNDLLKIQTKEYIDFIKKFTETINIMTKNFFIVVPYTPSQINTRRGIDFINKENKTKNQIKSDSFEENRTQLEQRVLITEQGISACGIRVVRLGTEELIEVFYKIFNPGDVEKPIINS